MVSRRSSSEEHQPFVYVNSDTDGGDFRYCEYLRDTAMSMYGISHTVNTKIGDEYVRGVSGGERKRVTIAEITLAGAPFQCWDK